MHNASIDGLEHAHVQRSVVHGEEYVAFHVLELLFGDRNALCAKIPVPSVGNALRRDTSALVMGLFDAEVSQENVKATFEFAEIERFDRP